MQVYFLLPCLYVLQRACQHVQPQLAGPFELESFARLLELESLFVFFETLFGVKGYSDVEDGDSLCPDTIDVPLAFVVRAGFYLSPFVPYRHGRQSYHSELIGFDGSSRTQTDRAHICVVPKLSHPP